MKWKRQNRKQNTRQRKRGVLIVLSVLVLCSAIGYQYQGKERQIGYVSLRKAEGKTISEAYSEEEETGDIPETESEREIQENPETESEEKTERDPETESERNPETESEEESERNPETESEEESEDIPEIEGDLEPESESESEVESESENRQEMESEKAMPFEVILVTGGRYARAANQASVDTFGELEILGARTAYKHHKETFQTIYCLNYIRNGAYGIYGSDRLTPVHPSITYVLAKGMKLAKNNETMDVMYRGENDQESYYITQMALHLVNAAIGGEEDISGYLDASKNPSVYQKIYALYQDAMAQKEPIVDGGGYTKEVTCEILPKTQNTWIKDEGKGGYRTKENFKIKVSDPTRVFESSVSISNSTVTGLSVVEAGEDCYYLHATDKAFEELKKQSQIKITMLWSGQVQEKTGYRYIHLSGDWPGITDYQDLIFLEDAEQPVTLQQTASATLEVVPAEKGKITVIKKDEETQKGLKGAVFGIYEERTCKTLVTKTGSSDETGSGSTPEFELKESGSYFLKEIKAPLYHVLDQTVTEIPVEDLKGGKTVTYIRENKAQKGKIILQKEDDNPEEERIEGSLEGAVYLVFAKEIICKTDLVTTAYVAYQEGDDETSKSFVGSLTTDENGKAEINGLYPGKYLVFEKTPSEGYQREEVIHEVEVLPENETQTLITKQVTSKEKKIRGDLELKKTGEKNGEMIALEGAEFVITSKKDGREIAVLVTDKDGYATTKKENMEGNLIYGTYLVTETKAPEGYEEAKPFEVKIEENNHLYQYEVENRQKKGTLQIQKIDAETKKAIPAAGVEFRILEKESGHLVVQDLKTDSTGKITLEEGLPFGTYLLEEVTAPPGYQKGKIEEFSIDQEKLVQIVYENVPVKGKITLQKQERESGEGLSQVVFVITAKEDIVTLDGSVRLKAGEIADTVTTDENGQAVSRELYPGLYEICEEKQKPGYVKEIDPREIRIKENGEITEKIIFENDPTRLKIKKTEEGSEKGLEGVVFQIWREGEEKEFYTTDKNGEIVAERLVPGTYYVEEAKAKTGYIKAEQRFSFEVDQDGKINGKTEVEYHASNTKMEAKIKVAKLADKTTGVYLEDGRYQGKKVSGIYTSGEMVEYRILITNSGNVTAKEITVCDQMQEELKRQVVEESAEFTTETGDYQTTFGKHTMVTRISATEILIEELVPGDSLEVRFRVLLREDAIKSEELENRVYVTGKYEPEEGVKEAIPEDEDDWDSDKIKIENEIVVEILKVDAQTEQPLKGATLAVLDDKGILIDEWVSQEQAHRVEGVEVRKVYTLKEIEAPENYQRASSFTFTVLDTKKVQTIVMKDEPVPEEISTNPQSPSTKPVAKTGDETEIARYVASILMAVCIVGTILMKRRKKDET
ncbi:MAG: SpaA isopeptide-forming pilin-related protein [Lachnospiraceae bacterium]|nr:SpaA isopeptide-forming pilin-related protein [Lachnospiraceae bacterium]